jgi:type IV pilus assembly protein PilF
MNLIRIFLICISLAVTACITTTTGDMRSPASKEDAARLNMDLGISYLRKGDLEDAAVKLEKSIDVQPDNATAHRVLGMTYERMGDDPGAEKQYRIAAKQAPDDPDALNQLAIFLCAHDDAKEALKLFDRAVKVPRYQNRAMLYTNAGTCAKGLDLALAETYLRSALTMSPDYAEALLQMGDVAYLRENYLQARAFIERYEVDAPVNADILWLAYRVEMAMHDQAAANQMAKRLLRDFPESAEARQLLEERRNAI